MKNKITLLTAAIFLSIGIFAQVPQKINYQAVARDASGNPMLSTSLTVIFDIHEGTGLGTVKYSETHNLTTNQFGLFTAAIGGGTPNSPFVLTDFVTNIIWGLNKYFLQVTVNGDAMQPTQLLSVPYALHAGTAATGTPGADGLNCWDLNGNGVQDTAEDINGDGIWNVLDCKGDTGVAGANGIGINWLGALTTPPASPNTNDAYYDSTVGVSYIWDGTGWQIIAQDGATSTYTAGTGISISGGVISNTGDLDTTNELQVLSISNDTIFLSNGGSIVLPPSTGDNWGTQTVNVDGTTIFGDGNATSLSGFDGQYSNLTGTPTNVSTFTNDVPYLTTFTEVDADTTNELQILTISNDTIFLSNGGFVQLPTAVGDNWGTQTVNVDGTTIFGDGNATSLSGFDGQYSNLTGTPTNVSTFTNDAGYITSPNDADFDPNNEIQNLSVAGNTINISGGTGTTISATAPTTGDYLYWNGTNWVAQTSSGDNWGTQTAVTDTTLTGTGIAGTPLSVNLNIIPTQTSQLTNNSGFITSPNDADANPANELITSFGVNGANLEIVENGYSWNVPLISLTPAGKWTENAGNLFPTTLANNVGIGTATPSYPFHVQKSVANIFAASIENTSASGWGLEIRTLDTSSIRNALEIDNNNVTNFVIKNNGSVGIGTATPSAKLHLEGSLRLNNLSFTAPAVGAVLTSIDALGNAEWQPLPSAPTTYWSQMGNDLYPTTLTNNVGIGTVTPSHPFHVLSNDTIMAAFTGNNTFGSVILVENASTEMAGTLYKSSSDSAFVGYSAQDKTLTMETFSNIPNGKIRLSTSDKIDLRADTIYAQASGGNPIYNFNKGTFATDSLYVFGANASNAGYLLTNNGNGKAEWQPPTMTTTYWSPNGTNIYNNNSGKVGIGTNLPHSKLHIADDFSNGVTIEVASSTDLPFVRFQRAQGSLSAPMQILVNDVLGGIEFAGFDGGSYGLGAKIEAIADEAFTTTARGTHLAFLTTPINTGFPTEAMRIEGNGNVGIGIAQPESKLHIRLPNSTFTNVLQLGNGNQPNREWLFKVDGTSQFSIANENLGTEFTALSITNTGNVGIGTTTPAAQLEVVRGTLGNIQLFPTSSTSYPLMINPTGSGGKYLQFNHQNGISMNFGSNGSSGLIGTTSNHNLFLVTNNSIAATITNTGNVGIGTTTPGTSLEVDGAVTYTPATAAAGNSASYALTVGDRSYIRVTTTLGGATLGSISNGLKSGQLLIIENVGGYLFTINDGGANLNIAGNAGLYTDDTITLIWTGSKWLELSRSNN